MKGRELLSLPIIDLRNGKYLGEVQEIINDAAGKRICGFLIKNKNRREKVLFLAWEDIYAVGSDAIVVVNDSLFINPQKQTEYAELLKCKTDLPGRQLFAETGSSLGVISDLIYNEISGEITAMEMSEGLISDLLRGRRQRTFPDKYQIKGKTVFVPLPETENELEGINRGEKK